MSFSFGFCSKAYLSRLVTCPTELIKVKTHFLKRFDYLTGQTDPPTVRPSSSQSLRPHRLSFHHPHGRSPRALSWLLSNSLARLGIWAVFLHVSANRQGLS